MKGPVAHDLGGWLHTYRQTSGMPSFCAALSTPTEWGRGWGGGFCSLVAGTIDILSIYLLSWNREVPVLLSLKLPVLREAACSQKSKWSPPFPRNIHRLPLLQAASQRIIPFCGSWLRVHPSSQAHYSSDYSHAGPVGTQSHQ